MLKTTGARPRPCHPQGPATIDVHVARISCLVTSLAQGRYPKNGRVCKSSPSGTEVCVHPKQNHSVGDTVAERHTVVRRRKTVCQHFGPGFDMTVSMKRHRKTHQGSWMASAMHDTRPLAPRANRRLSRRLTFITPLNRAVRRDPMSMRQLDSVHS